MTTLTVPVIDLSPFYAGGAAAKLKLAEAIDVICQDIGFLVVKGHPIDPALIKKTYEVCLEFFDLPESEKMKILQPHDFTVRGYSPMLSEGLSYSIGKKTPPDMKEGLWAGPPGMPEAKYLLGDPYYGCEAAGTHYLPNLWPDKPPELRPILEEHFRAMTEFGFDLHRLFCIALGLPEDFFYPFIDKPFSSFRALHYPKLECEPEPGQVRAGEHSDYDNVTICTVGPGLQCRNRNGDWVDIPVIEGTLVVNLGDLLMRWTNDRWVSTRHRVINPPIDSDSNCRRLSLIHFVECNYDAIIECLPTCQSDDQPPKYPPIGASDYIIEKYTRQTRFEEWSDESSELYGTVDTESRFEGTDSAH